MYIYIYMWKTSMTDKYCSTVPPFHPFSVQSLPRTLVIVCKTMSPIFTLMVPGQWLAFITPFRCQTRQRVILKQRLRGTVNYLTRGRLDSENAPWFGFKIHPRSAAWMDFPWPLLKIQYRRGRQAESFYANVQVNLQMVASLLIMLLGATGGWRIPLNHQESFEWPIPNKACANRTRPWEIPYKWRFEQKIHL